MKSGKGLSKQSLQVGTVVTAVTFMWSSEIIQWSQTYLPLNSLHFQQVCLAFKSYPLMRGTTAQAKENYDVCAWSLD